MRERVPLGGEVAPAIGEVLEDRRHRPDLGVHGQPDARREAGPVLERDPDGIEALDGAGAGSHDRHGVGLYRLVGSRRGSVWSGSRIPTRITPKGRMTMPKKVAGEGVYRVIDVIGTSKRSWEDATKNAVETATRSLRDLRIAEVQKLDVKIDNGKIVAYRARVQVSFKYES
jgi:flavin-binding protein dodecin